MVENRIFLVYLRAEYKNAYKPKKISYKKKEFS